MHDPKPDDRTIADAVAVIRSFITETTGKPPTDREIADALNRYFVLNEIKDHILMVRDKEKTRES